MRIPDEVEAACRQFCTLADAAAPGLLTGLHLHGSLVFGEYHPGRSDVDVVAVLAHRPDDAEFDALRAVHARLAAAGGPRVDGPHVLAGDLTRPPADCPDVPCVLGHEFGPGRSDVNPVTWHEPAERGISVRGGLPDVWTDVDALVAFTRDNLDRYWARGASRWRPTTHAGTS